MAVLKVFRCAHCAGSWDASDWGLEFFKNEVVGGGAVEVEVAGGGAAKTRSTLASNVSSCTPTLKPSSSSPVA